MLKEDTIIKRHMCSVNCGSVSGRIKKKNWPGPDPKFKVHFGSFLDPGCIYNDVEQYSENKFEMIDIFYPIT